MATVGKNMETGKIEEGELPPNEEELLLYPTGDNIGMAGVSKPEKEGTLSTGGAKSKKPKVVLPKPTLTRDKEIAVLKKILVLDPLGLADEDYAHFKMAKERLHEVMILEKKESVF